MLLVCNCSQAFTMKLFLSLLLATCTSALTLSSPAALQRPSINMPARSLLRMSEEGAKPAASTEPAPAEKAAVDFTPKAVAEPPKEEGIDWSK